MVCGLLGLALAAVAPLRAQEAVTNAPSGPVVTAYLDYQEVNYTFDNCFTSPGRRAPVFKKEPALSGGKVDRGTLRLGDSPNEDMGFVWDRTAGKALPGPEPESGPDG